MNPLEETVWNYIEEFSDHDPDLAVYADNASRRDTNPLNDDEKESVQRAIRSVEAEQKQCYRNTQLLINALGHATDFTYAEGLLISKDVPLPIKHAWVELNGKVCEITLPEAPEQPEGAVYIGVTFDNETVIDATEQRTKTDALAGWLDGGRLV